MFPTSSAAWTQQDVSPLKTLIARATYPSQPEPNYALNLEVAEYINQKKANTYVYTRTSSQSANLISYASLSMCNPNPILVYYNSTSLLSPSTTR